MRGGTVEPKARYSTAGQEDRLALISPGSATARFTATLPERAVLNVGLGYAASDSATGQEVRFVVSVSGGGGAKVVLDEPVIATASGTWRDHEVDLAPWSGQTVVLALETIRSEGDVPLWAAWSSPEISSEGEPEDHWNVILIILDTLRADRLGSYGHDRPTSPNLDALAARGVRFETAVSQSPWTRPSHISLFSGLYPASVHAVGHRPLAWQFSHAGYLTWAVTGGGQIHPAFGFGTGFDRYRVDNWVRDVPGVLEQFAANASRSQFLFLHTYEIHDPYRHTALVGELPEGRMRRPYSLEKYKRQKALGIDPNEAEQEYVRALYDSGVAFTDLSLGKLFQGLETRGWLENTVVVVTSDHGEQHWEHSAFGHGKNLYDHQLLVPLILYVPPGLALEAGLPRPQGTVIDQQVQLVDLYPTLLELLGIETEQPVSGRSLLPMLRGEALPEVAAFAENTTVNPQKKALRSRRYKFVRTFSDGTGEPEFELYDLEADPGERTNIASAHSDVVADLSARMLSLMAGSQADRTEAGFSPKIDPQLRRQLEALGYLND